ncbi:MAG: glycine cleavage system protein H, partial [Planctomycetes bacterium]|nr:glycine cleavage system protein H [Planctomycetota bacterium]
GETFGEIESVKAVSDLYAPIAGEVLEINAAIEDHLEILSKDPWGAGWIIKVKPDSKKLDGLMDAAEYEKFVASKKH